jgi:RNA polymerase sigma-70 factor (subfamily 1)
VDNDESHADLESEEALARQATNGDIAALQTLLLQHHDRLRATIGQSISRSYQSIISADDVCQEAYTAAYASIRDFSWTGPDSFYAWLRTIAMRRLADAMRRQRAAKRGGERHAVAAGSPHGHSTVQLLELVARHSATPSRSAVRNELYETVQAAMGRLSPDHALALQLRYFDGLTAAQAGERMQRSAQAVHMLCARALAELERQLGDPAQILSRFA